MAAGQPTEGPGPSKPRASAALLHPPVCQLGDRAGDAAARAVAEGWPFTVVVDAAMVIAGRVRADVAADDQRSAEQAMEPGPPTIRPHEDLAATRERMTAHHVTHLLVSTPEGVLLGAISR